MNKSQILMDEVQTLGLNATHKFGLTVTIAGNVVPANLSTFGVPGSNLIYDISSVEGVSMDLQARQAFLSATAEQAVELPVVATESNGYINHSLIFPDGSQMPFWLVGASDIDDKDLLSVTIATVQAIKLVDIEVLSDKSSYTFV